MGRRGLDLTRDYVKERTAFGQPLSANQGVVFPMVEHLTKLEGVRLLAYHGLGSIGCWYQEHHDSFDGEVVGARCCDGCLA